MSKFSLDKTSIMDLISKCKNDQILINRVVDQDVTMKNGYQRDEVWSDVTKKELIVSMLMGNPFPSIILWRRNLEVSAIAEQKFEIIDGQQRISAIREFYDGKLLLKEKEYKKYFEGDECSINNLKPEFAKILNNYSISQIIMKHEKIEDAIDVFIKMNKNGKSLNNHEIREAENVSLTNNAILVKSFYKDEDISLFEITSLKDGTKKSRSREFVYKMFLLYQHNFIFLKDGKPTLDTKYKKQIDQKSFNEFLNHFKKFLNKITILFKNQKSKSFKTQMYLQIYYKLYSENKEKFDESFLKFQEYISITNMIDGQQKFQNQSKRDNFMMTSSIQDKQKKDSYKTLKEIIEE